MDAYLSKRRKPSKKRKKTAEKEFREEEKQYYSESFFQKIMNYILGEPIKEEIPEEVEIEEEKKELEEYNEKRDRFSFLRNIFSSEKKEEPKIIPDDIREVLKIQNKWIRKLPSELIKKFKESEDYNNYKETLKKYNLIK